ncbi:hypothetical protein ACWC9F_09655 [Streptomyces sp. NPDC001110]
MTALNELRLLPWSGPDDKPCYLSTDDPDGYMSRLADNIEAVQLRTAADLLADALGALGHDLTGALRNVLRVAISRGHLPAKSEPYRT